MLPRSLQGTIRALSRLLSPGVVLSLWLAVTPAWAGSMLLLGAGGVGGAALSPVILTYQMTTGGGNSGNTQTFGTITIGAAPGVNRRVIVAFSGNANGALPIVSAVFTPNAGSPISADVIQNSTVDPATNEFQALVSAVLPVGTTTTLVVTFTGSAVNGPAFSVYTVDNSTLSNPTTPTSSFLHGSSTSPITGTISTVAGGAVIGLFDGFGTSSNSWTAGITSSDGTFGNYNFGHLSNVAGGSLNVTNTWTVSGSGNPDLALWAFR